MKLLIKCCISPLPKILASKAGSCERELTHFQSLFSHSCHMNTFAIFILIDRIARSWVSSLVSLSPKWRAHKKHRVQRTTKELCRSCILDWRATRILLGKIVTCVPQPIKFVQYILCCSQNRIIFVIFL